MTTVLSPVPTLYYPNPNNTGAPAAAFKLFTYQAGTSIKQSTWTDSTQSVLNANPLPLDANGFAAASSASALWLDPTLVYKLVWAPANDTDPPSSPIRTIDNIRGPLDLATLTQALIGQLLYPRTTAEIAASVTPTNSSYPPLNVFRYGADGSGGAADTAAYTALAAVIAQLTGILDWPRNLGSILPNDVRRYGVKGDNSADDYAAFNRALTAWSGKAVYVPTPPVGYKLSTGLTIPDNTALIGDNKRSCKIIAGGNIDLVTLGDGSQLYGLYLEGNATTGHGIVVPSGKGNQTIQNCRALNHDVGTGGGVLHFADNTAGSRISVHDFEVSQTNGTSGSGKYAIYIPDVFINSAVPRKFTQIETGGKASFFLGGANDVFIGESFLADMSYSTNSRGVQFGTSRVANQVALTIDGAGHSYSGVDTAPQIILASTLTGSTIIPATINSGLNTFRTITAITQASSAVVTVSTGGSSNPFTVGQYVTFDSVLGMVEINGLTGLVTATGGSTGAWTITVAINSSGFTAYTSGGNLCARSIVDLTTGNNSNLVFLQRQVYNPGVSNSGGTFVMGNGSCLGYYARVGSATIVWINFTVGSTTTVGTTELRFTLPVSKQDGEVLTGGTGDINSGAQHYTVSVQVPGAVAYCRLFWSRNDGVNSGVVAGNSPVALGTGDVIRFMMTIEP